MYPFVLSLDNLRQHAKYPFQNFILDKEEYLLSNLHWLYLTKPYITHHKGKWVQYGLNYMKFPFEKYDGTYDSRGGFFCEETSLLTFLNYHTNKGLKKKNENSREVISPYFFIVVEDYSNDAFWVENGGYLYSIYINTDLGNEKCYEFLHYFLKLIFIDDAPIEKIKKEIDLHNQKYEAEYARYQESDTDLNEESEANPSIPLLMGLPSLPVPRSGNWQTTAILEKRSLYLNAGDTFPETQYDSSGNAVTWYLVQE